MKNIRKIYIIAGAALFLLLFGISQYKNIKIKNSPIYTVITESKAGAMTIGGMPSDKEKIDSFKKDLEQNNDSNNFWECIDKSDSYTKKGEYSQAVQELKKATIIYPNNHMPHAFLAQLYEKTEQYDLSIKEYDWVIEYQTQALEDALKTKNKLEIERREKIVNDLKAGRKRVEGLMQRESE